MAGSRLQAHRTARAGTGPARASRSRVGPSPVLASTKVKKVVLAYSGGLDTSVILKWLQDTYDCEVRPPPPPAAAAYVRNIGLTPLASLLPCLQVVTFTADLGQVGMPLRLPGPRSYTRARRCCR